MKDSYRDAYGTAIIYAHAKELEAGSVTVEELMNDYSPQAMELAEKISESPETEYSRLGSRFRQGDDDEEQGLAEYDLEW